MPSHAVPFPGDGATSPGMSIEIPKRSGGSAASSDENRKEQQTTRSAFHHHPRQPGPSADGYFSGCISSLHSSAGAPRTPGSTHRGAGGHSRNVSSGSAMASAQKGSHAMVAGHSASSHQAAQGSHVAMGATGSASQDWAHATQSPWVGVGGGLPSPSTLTDILLGLHSTLYGGKRSPEEVREMVWRYYDVDAVFESPLLSAIGREQVANQFIMAFALPGLDVTSELRDVICSDFEFDGTRAGIIDQTISVTIFPSIFGSSSSLSANSTHHGGNTGTHRFPSDRPIGNETPGQSEYPHSTITPHPFADYRTPGASTFGPSQHQQQHSPTTPYSLSSLWGGGGSSRPHTPGQAGGVRPLTSSAHPAHSINGDEEEPGQSMLGQNTVYASVDEAGGGTVHLSRMPLDANVPHWASQGLGRSTFGSLLWGLFHPRAVLKHLCTINLRVMSRLEFNDAGHIVRHEDSWGLRETIEGTIPFASLVYALERRIVGYIASWAVAKGFKLSSALHPRTIKDTHDSEIALLNDKDQYKADEAAHALLGRSRRSSAQFAGSGFYNPDHFQTISRSRAPSPSRLGWAHPTSATPYVTGTRSRARSSAGSLHGGSRRTSSDNLLNLSQSGSSGTYFASGYERGADKDLPPDSSARYKSLRRLEGGRASSTASAPPSELAGSFTTDGDGHVRQSKAPDRDLM